MQYQIGAAELGVLLALVRSGTLAGAGQLLGVDGSTVFRTVQRAEKALGQRLFERSRAGYQATELGVQLAERAERIESELEGARALVQSGSAAVSGRVRISTTDTLLNGLLLPVLRELMALHPRLELDLAASNERVNLTQREADIALRATSRPPPHLVGKALGPIRMGLFTARPRGRGKAAAIDPSTASWIAVDEALPEHPSVLWRRRHHPHVTPRVLVNSIQSVLEGVVAGVGIGVVPLFLVGPRDDLLALGEPIAECETQLWLLTHPESRHLRRIATVAHHLACTVVPR